MASITWASPITTPTAGLELTAGASVVGPSTSLVGVEVSPDNTNWYSANASAVWEAGKAQSVSLPAGTFVRLVPLALTPASGRVDFW